MHPSPSSSSLLPQILHIYSPSFIKYICLHHSHLIAFVFTTHIFIALVFGTHIFIAFFFTMHIFIVFVFTTQHHFCVCFYDTHCVHFYDAHIFSLSNFTSPLVCPLRGCVVILSFCVRSYVTYSSRSFLRHI